MKTTRFAKIKASCGSCMQFRPAAQGGGSMGFCRYFRQAKSREDGCQSGFVAKQGARNRPS